MAIAAPLILGAIGSELAAGTAIGAAAGWAIGSAVGSLIEQASAAPTAAPNQLTDLSVQTSAWGTSIPEIFGTQRVSGNIIWSTDKKLTGGSTGKFGGKGGGGGKSGKKGPSEGYYTCDLALALCEGPIAGIKKIWAGGRLIFDDSNPVFVPDMNSSSPGSGTYQQLSATNGPVVSTGSSALGSWTLYHGTMQQDADPTIAGNGAANGAGGVPYQATTLANGYTYALGDPQFGKTGTACAYRGIAYIVFQNLNLGYGGTIPPLSFEIVARQGGVSQIVVQSSSLVPLPAHGVTGYNAGVAMIPGGTLVFGDGSTFNTETATAGSTAAPGFTVAQSGTGSAPAGFSSAATSAAGQSTPPPAWLAGDQWAVVNVPGTSRVFYVSTGAHSQNLSVAMQDFATGAQAGPIEVAAGFFANGAGVNPTVVGGTLWITLSGSLSAVAITNLGGDWAISLATLPGKPNPIGVQTLYQQPWPVVGSAAYYTYSAGTTEYLVALADGGGVSVQALPQGTGTPAQVTDGTHLIFANASTIELATPSPFAVVKTITAQGVALSPPLTGCAYNPTLNALVAVDANTGHLVAVSLADGSTLAQSAGAVGSQLFVDTASGNTVAVNYGANNTQVQVCSSGQNTLSPTPATLGAVVQAICARASVPASSVDVSLLPASPVNLTRPANTVARDALRTLALAYTFDLVDSAGVLRCVPRGCAIAYNLAMSEAGFGRVSATGTPASPFSRSRVSTVELPRSVSVKYSSAAAVYNTYTTRAEVSAQPGGKDVTVSLPLTLADVDAQKLAQYLVSAPWIEREAVTWSSPLYLAYLEPGDLVQLPDGAAYRITSVAIDDAQRVPTASFTAVNDAATVLRLGGAGLASLFPAYAPAQATATTSAPLTAAPGAFAQQVAGAIGAGHAVPQPKITNPGVALGALFELPPLSSASSPALYCAAWSSGDVFLTTALAQSLDGGSSYAVVGHTNAPSAVGTAYNALPDGQTASWDNASTVDVYLANPAEMSLTPATPAQIFAGANLAWLGSELIQFSNANAMSDAAGRPFYRLSRLLRGRRGTEFATSTHAPGDRFVLVDAGQSSPEIAVPYALQQINAPLSYIVATAGTDPTTAPAIPYAITGVFFRAWSPLLQSVTTDTAGDVSVAVIPRARLTGAWGSGVTPSLDPDATNYRASIYNRAGSLVRTISGPYATSGATAITYTAAQQSADGLTSLSGVVMQVATVQANVGPGIPLAVAL